MPPGNQLSLEPVKLSAAFSQRAGRGGLLGGGGRGAVRSTSPEDTAVRTGLAAAASLPLSGPGCVCASGVAKVWVTSALARSSAAQALVVGALTALRVELRDGGHLGNDIKSGLSAGCNWPQHAENGL